MSVPLGARELRVIFDDDVRPWIFRHAVTVDEPTAVLLGGQPGAGKSRASQQLMQGFGHNIAAIIGDDLRRFHPDYERIVVDEPLSMPAITAEASGTWVQMAIAEAARLKVNVLVEGTFRRADVTLRTAAELHAAGHTTQLVALAVPAPVSRLSAMTRYVDAHRAGQAARWSDLPAHEAGFHGAALTLTEAASSPDVDRLTVVTREGTALFDAARPAALDGGVIALEDGRNAPLPAAAARQWLERYRDGHEYLQETGQINETTAPLLDQLSRDTVVIQDELRTHNAEHVAELHQWLRGDLPATTRQDAYPESPHRQERGYRV